MNQPQQPQNPLLRSPISRLPREVLDEVFEYLEDVENNSERIKVGKTVSLVCRDWLVGGRHIVWAAVTLYCNGVDELAVKLAEAQNKHLTANIRELLIRSKQPVSEDNASAVSDGVVDRALVIALQVIEGCSSRLKTLDVRPMALANGVNLDRIARSSAAPTLANLGLNVQVGPACSPIDLASALVRFAGLWHLAVRVEWNGLSDLSQLLSIGKASLRLRMLTLADDQDPQDTALLGGRLSRALLPLWDTSALRTITLVVTMANSHDLAWLAELPQLKEICLGTPHNHSSPAVFLRMIEVVKTLQQVEYVNINPDMLRPDDAEYDLEVSPVELDDLLSSLPPNLEKYEISNAVFDDTVGLSFVFEQDEAPGSPHVVLYIEAGIIGATPTRVILVRELKGDGRQTWGILADVRFCLSLSLFRRPGRPQSDSVPLAGRPRRAPLSALSTSATSATTRTRRSRSTEAAKAEPTAVAPSVSLRRAVLSPTLVPSLSSYALSPSSLPLQLPLASLPASSPSSLPRLYLVSASPRNLSWRTLIPPPLPSFMPLIAMQSYHRSPSRETSPTTRAARARARETLPKPDPLSLSRSSCESGLAL